MEWGAPRYREACARDSGTLSRGSTPRATASHQQILILMDGARPAAGIVWQLFAAAQPRLLRLLLLAGGEMSRRAPRSGSRCRHVHPGHSGGAKMWCAFSKTYDAIAEEQVGGRRRWRARARRNFPFRLGRGQFGRRRMLRRIYAGSTALRSSQAVVVSSGAPREAERRVLAAAG